MLFGWLRRRKRDSMDDAERREWEAFAEEMQQVLGNVDTLLRLQDQEDETAVQLGDLWHPRYFSTDFNQDRLMTPPCMLARPIPMPSPVVYADAQPNIEHRAVDLMGSVRLSHFEIALRRTPADMRHLAAQVGEDVGKRVAEALMGVSSDPLKRARWLERSRG